MKIKYIWKCKYCNFVGDTRSSLKNHHKDFHGFERYKFPKWNKGLTKETDERIKLQSEKLSELKKGKPGRKQTDETKRKISETNKIKHTLGRI